MFEPFKKGTTTSSLKTLQERPKLAAHIGLIMGMWAVVESELSRLLSIMLQSDAEVGATLFSVIKAEAGRLAMIEAIAKDRLTSEQQAEFAGLKKRVTSVGGYRDRLAHNIWAISEDHPDSLILFDARAGAQFMAHLTSNVPGRGIFPRQDPEKSTSALMNHLDSAREYTEKEFLYIESEIAAVSVAIVRFSQKLTPPSPWQNFPENP